jgi:hypothetical protein
MAITSSFANLATVTRASKKTDAGGWDFTNGGAVGTLTEYASGVAAIHPTAGFLLEEVTTNEIRNPRGEGAVLGSPGTLPTNWSFSGLGTATAEVIAQGVQSGWPYLELKLSGTPSGAITLLFETSSAVTAATGETWTTSVGVQIASGDLSNVTALTIDHVERTSGGSFVATQTGSNFLPDTTHRRFWSAATLAGGGTVGRVVPGVRVDWDGSGAIDITLRIYAPQLEEKAYPTSPVLPTALNPAASTRAADLTTFALGSWFSSTAWTVFFSFKPATAGVTGTVLGGIGDTFDNTVYLDIGSSGGTRANASFRSGGSSSANLTPSGQSDYAVGDTMMAAIGAEADNFAMSLNGATQATDTSGAMPVSNSRLSLGNGPWSASVNNTFCGYITDFRYFPRRLSNAELEALVGN